MRHREEPRSRIALRVELVPADVPGRRRAAPIHPLIFRPTRYVPSKCSVHARASVRNGSSSSPSAAASSATQCAFTESSSAELTTSFSGPSQGMKPP